MPSMIVFMMLVRVRGATEQLPKQKTSPRYEQNAPEDLVLIPCKMSKVSLKAIAQHQENGSQNQGSCDVTKAGPRRNPQGSSHGPSLGACEDRNGHPVIRKDRVKECYQKRRQQEQQ